LSFQYIKEIHRAQTQVGIKIAYLDGKVPKKRDLNGLQLNHITHMGGDSHLARLSLSFGLKSRVQINLKGGDGDRW
jgi:hypothetical protein